jgi:hypothetical protein
VESSAKGWRLIELGYAGRFWYVCVVMLWSWEDVGELGERGKRE